MRHAAFALGLVAFAAPAAAQSAGEAVLRETSHQARFQVVEVASGFELPWALAWLPDGTLLVTERSGALNRVSADGSATAIDHGLDVTVLNQGGLFDVAVPPNFADTGLLYLAFATGGRAEPTTALARGRLNPARDALEDVEVIFTADMRAQRGRHFGGKLVFDGPDTLYLTLGDGGGFQDESQDPTNHWGAIVRLSADGTPKPADGLPADAAAGLFSYGHRNVQGAALHPETGALWTHEHGARGGDEINIVAGGENHGWPAVTYGINYNGTVISEAQSGPEFTEPVWYWRPSIAASGMAFYTGDAFPNWRGDLFVGGLVAQRVERFEVDGDRVIGMEPLLLELGERIRDVRQGPDGLLYVATDSPEGRVLRLEPLE